MPISKEWKNIGTLIKIPGGTLDRIAHDEQFIANNCLREMLQEWLKQTNPLPTWTQIIEAVKLFNPSVADEMKQYLVDTKPEVDS